MLSVPLVTVWEILVIWLMLVVFTNQYSLVFTNHMESIIFEIRMELYNFACPLRYFYESSVLSNGRSNETCRRKWETLDLSDRVSRYDVWLYLLCTWVNSSHANLLAACNVSSDSQKSTKFENRLYWKFQNLKTLKLITLTFIDRIFKLKTKKKNHPPNWYFQTSSDYRICVAFSQWILKSR